MKHKRLKLSALLLFGLGLTELQAQTLYVKEKSGTQTAYQLSSVRKLTFSSGNVTVLKTDKTTTAYALSGLRYVKFGDITTATTEQFVFDKQEFVSYPNPVSDVLTLDLTSLKNKQGTLRILALDGSELLTYQTTGENTETVQVNSLPQGIYLCQFANENEIKTLKIIKQ